MEDILSRKLVIIGSGKISESHIEAAQANGFHLHGICSSKNSQTAFNLAKKYNFTNYYPNIENLLETNFDAAAIICDTINIPRVYEKMYRRNIPIIVEKPFSVNPEDFSKAMLSSNKTLVGYNRRYYSSIHALKNKLNSEPYYNAVVEISEISWDSNSSDTERTRSVLDNSVHLLDLILYLFGDYNSIEIDRCYFGRGLKAINAKLSYLDGVTVELRISFGIPLNNSISVRFKDSVADCKPIEMFTSLNKMEMIAPDSRIKFKRYQPISTEHWTLSKHDNAFKPGFYLQYKELSDLVDGKSIRIGATLTQAYKVLMLSRELLGIDNES